MKITFRLLFSLFFYGFVFSAKAQIITTIAGDGTPADIVDSSLAINAGLYAPYAVTLDGLGNYYIADSYASLICKVNAAGSITVVAGIQTGSGGYNGDGIPANTAEVNRPNGMAFDKLGNLYFADAFNNRIRKINVATGIITTVAGKGNAGYNGDNIPADSAELYDPHGVAIDAIGNLYITDFDNHRIRKVDTSGIITTIAGTGVAGYSGDNGAADTAEINGPYGIAVDNSSNIYFTDIYSSVVRKINLSGIITTFAGPGTGDSSGNNGPADSAKLYSPAGLAIDGSGNIFFTDAGSSLIHEIAITTGIITIVAGNGVLGYSGDHGPATLAELRQPTGVAVDGTDNLYIADFGNSRIRRSGWPAGINNLQVQNRNLILYPNPSKGVFTVSIASSVQEQVQVTITNILGEKVKEITVFTNSPTIISLDQPAGIYYLSATGIHGSSRGIINLMK